MVLNPARGQAANPSYGLRLRYLGSSTHMVTAREYQPWSSGGRLYRLGAGNLDTQQAFFYLQYSYDPVGNITAIDDQANPSLTQSFAYDELDRLLTASATGNGSYSESYSYDANGRLATKAGVTYAYNSGHYHAVSGLSNGNAYGYDANGNMTARSVGGVSYALEYDADNHLSRQGVVDQDGYRYVYDGDGALVVKINEASGARSVYLGSYAEVTDGETAQPTPTASATPSPTITRTPVPTRTPTASPTLSRTPTRSATPTPMLGASRTTTPASTLTPTKTATPMLGASPHAGTRTATNPVYTAIVHTATPTLDTRTRTRTPTLTWTPSRTPTKTKTPTNPPTFTPTPSNTLTPSLTPTPTQSLTPTASPNPNLVGMTWTFYYLAGSERIAMRVVDGGSSQLYYLFTDHLGNTSEVRLANGSQPIRQYYRAFGEERYTSGVLPTDRTYSGQREIENGLVHYGARIYDPVLARFVQADTIIPQPGSPMAWDRFAYTLNNPIRYNDPNGHDVGCAGTDASNCSSLNKPIHRSSANIKMDITLNLVIDIKAIQEEISSDKDYAQVPIIGNQTISIGSPESVADPIGALNSLLGPSAEVEVIKASQPDFFVTIHTDVCQNSYDPSLFVFYLRAVDISNESSVAFNMWNIIIGNHVYQLQNSKIESGGRLRILLGDEYVILGKKVPLNIQFQGNIRKYERPNDPVGGYRMNQTKISQGLPTYLFEMESRPGGRIFIEE